MGQRASLLIKNGTCATPGGIVAADVALKDGRIVAVGALGDDAEQVIDATGLHVLPGVIDSQVHFREPGLEHKEDLATGCLLYTSPSPRDLSTSRMPSSA